MSGGERTPQRLDPLGTYAAWPIVPIVGGIVVAYTIYSTLAHLNQMTNPTLAWLAVLVIAGASLYYTLRSRAARAPFTRPAFVVVIVLSMIASTMFTASVWGHNKLVQDDWGQIAIALTLFSLPLYRPIADVIVGGVVAAVVVGTEAALESSFLSIANSPLVYFTVAATPVLALALGGSAYAWVITGHVLHWGEVAREAQLRLDPEMKAGAARIIHQEGVTLLNSATVPFFVDLLERDELTSDDVETARSIAASLRRHAVEDVDRGWLDETLLRSVEHPSVTAVIDPERLADTMTAEHRGIVGALIATSAQLHGFDPQSLSVRIDRNGGRCRAVVTADIAASRRELRREFLPYLSALLSVSRDAELATRDGSMTIQFSYGKS